MNTLSYKQYDFEKAHNSAFSSLYINKNLQMALCIAEQEYIPIDYFKGAFESVTDILSQYTMTTFVFDKRKLRTFHQPSMEWYFSVWKPQVKEKGLIHHFKILPELDWFVKAVEAGKHEIYQKFGKDIVNGISIEYVKNIEEAIDVTETRTTIKLK